MKSIYEALLVVRVFFWLIFCYFFHKVCKPLKLGAFNAFIYCDFFSTNLKTHFYIVKILFEAEIALVKVSNVSSLCKR